jgi:hypothetical protein
MAGDFTVCPRVRIDDLAAERSPSPYPAIHGIFDLQKTRTRIERSTNLTVRDGEARMAARSAHNIYLGLFRIARTGHAPQVLLHDSRLATASPDALAGVIASSTTPLSGMARTSS